MVLCLKAWESKSLPGQPKRAMRKPIPLADKIRLPSLCRPQRAVRSQKAACPAPRGRICILRDSPSADPNKVDAGWSSPVARQAHNLKVVGSNPTPAPIKALAQQGEGFLRSRRKVVKATLTEDC